MSGLHQRAMQYEDEHKSIQAMYVNSRGIHYVNRFVDYDFLLRYTLVDSLLVDCPPMVIFTQFAGSSTRFGSRPTQGPVPSEIRNYVDTSCSPISTGVSILIHLRLYNRFKENRTMQMTGNSNMGENSLTA